MGRLVGRVLIGVSECILRACSPHIEADSTLIPELTLVDSPAMSGNRSVEDERVDERGHYCPHFHHLTYQVSSRRHEGSGIDRNHDQRTPGAINHARRVKLT